MYQKKTFLAIIPARSGSKGLPNKNIKELCGKPLMAWSIEAGLQSKYIDEVVVSTDSKLYAEIAKNYGAQAPFLRPQELSLDTSTTFDSIKHTIDFYKNQLNKTFDYTVLLEPTSPLRDTNDIDLMIERLLSNDNDSITSIGEISEHPSIVKKIIDGRIVPFSNEILQTTRRQDNLPAYFPYGVAYIAKTEILLQEKTFYTERCDFFIIKRWQCYEIDDLFDFICIEAIMQYLNSKKGNE